MKMKYMDLPTYEDVDIVGKTSEAVTGTVDRKLVGRSLITVQAGFTGKHVVVKGDETPIVTVQKIGDGEGEHAEVELFAELVGGKRSLASYKFFGGYVGDNRENAGVKELYVQEGSENHGKVRRLLDTAERMCDAAPECDGQWKIVSADGTRWFIRLFKADLKANGKFANE